MPDEKIGSKQRFEAFDQPEFFQRISEKHPLDLWIGVNSDGEKTLRFFGEFTPQRVSGTNAINIKQMMIEGRKAIQFSLADPSCAELFYRFCDDVIETSAKESNQQGGYHFLITRYAKWKKMFVAKKNIISEERIRGLIGELLFLRDFMIPNFGFHVALDSWSASEPTLKDFSIGKNWFEIKTATPNAESVIISSTSQLESDQEGTLVIYFLEKMSEAFCGITLNNLVIQINMLITSPEDSDLFMSKLYLDGYTFNEEYDKYVFDLKQTQKYRVGIHFPCLRTRDLPKSVSRCKYELLLCEIFDFLIKN